MIRFNNDYSEGALSEIMDALVKTNLEQSSGYGTDTHCEKAREYIRRECNAPSADVHLLVGGTQTNLVVIASALRPHQCALCVSSGHINVHETGAIEASGHKVLAVPGKNGKICAEDIISVHDSHFSDPDSEHIAQPKLVYISNSTEWGTIYTKKELCEISDACKKCGFYLFLDGARLGYALTSKENDLTLSDIAALCDVFYIGGTKCGALFGEAVVITNDNLKEDFRCIMKQRGAMLAKGRLLGIQFEELFRDGLYFRACRHANELSEIIRKAFSDKGVKFYIDSPTNQQFPILSSAQIKKLSEKFVFADNFGKVGTDEFACRFCTSWATSKENVEELVDFIKNNL